MKESMFNKNLFTVMFGILIIGGAAALIGAYHAAKNIEYSLSNDLEEFDGDIFV